MFENGNEGAAERGKTRKEGELRTPVILKLKEEGRGVKKKFSNKGGGLQKIRKCKGPTDQRPYGGTSHHQPPPTHPPPEPHALRPPRPTHNPIRTRPPAPATTPQGPHHQTTTERLTEPHIHGPQTPQAYNRDEPRTDKKEKRLRFSRQ